MASSDRQGGLLVNTTSVRTLFMRQYKKFLKLFYHKAYVWQFLEANGEMEMFIEAQERLRDLLSGYEDMMIRSCESESTNNSQKTMVGMRPSRDAERRGATDAGAGGAGRDPPAEVVAG